MPRRGRWYDGDGKGYETRSQHKLGGGGGQRGCDSRGGNEYRMRCAISVTIGLTVEVGRIDCSMEVSVLSTTTRGEEERCKLNGDGER